MNNSYTLVIPTLNRNHLLQRALRFYESIKFPHPIIIVDGSTDKHFIPSYNLAVTYLHCPKMAYTNRLKHALIFMKSDFCSIAGDDDFVLSAGLDECLSFLKKNTSYSSVQGRSARFITKPKIIFAPDEVCSTNEDIFFKDPIERAKYGIVKNYTQTFYSIFRKDILSAILKNIDKVNLELAELYFTFLTHYKGKHKVLNNLFFVRENSPTSSGKALRGPEYFAVYSRENGFYKNFLNTLANETEQDERVIEKVFSDYFLKTDPNIWDKLDIYNNPAIKIKNKIINGIFSMKIRNLLSKDKFSERFIQQKHVDVTTLKSEYDIVFDSPKDFDIFLNIKKIVQEIPQKDSYEL